MPKSDHPNESSELIYEISTTLHDQTAAIKLMSNLLNTLTDNVMSQHILVREVMAVLSEASPLSSNKVRQRLENLLHAENNQAMQTILSKSLAMLKPHEQNEAIQSPPR